MSNAEMLLLVFGICTGGLACIAIYECESLLRRLKDLQDEISKLREREAGRCAKELKRMELDYEFLTGEKL